MINSICLCQPESQERERLRVCWSFIYLLTGQHRRMLLLKATSICIQSEVSGAAGICREEPGVYTDLCRAKQRWPPVLPFGNLLIALHGSNRQQPRGLKRGCSHCSGTSPGRALPALGRGTILQPLTSFQWDQAQTSVPIGDCARPPWRTDTLCNAETDFTEESGITMPRSKSAQHPQDLAFSV